MDSGLESTIIVGELGENDNCSTDRCSDVYFGGWIIHDKERKAFTIECEKQNGIVFEYKNNAGWSKFKCINSKGFIVIEH